MTAPRTVALLALAAALSIPGAAPAAHEKPDCPFAPNPTAYNGSASCLFVLKGMPLTIRGDSTSAIPTVHVWVTIEGYPEVPPLAECSADDNDDGKVDGKAGCVGKSNPAIPSFVVPDQVAPLLVRCNVQGSGSGTYHCQSNTG